MPSMMIMLTMAKPMMMVMMLEMEMDNVDENILLALVWFGGLVDLDWWFGGLVRVPCAKSFWRTMPMQMYCGHSLSWYVNLYLCNCICAFDADANLLRAFSLVCQLPQALI